MAAQLKINRGIEVSDDAMRRWLAQLGWLWKRAKLTLKNDDPLRLKKLARIRRIFEHLSTRQILLFGDELDIHLLPNVGYQWMEEGTQLEVMTLRSIEKNYLAGALDVLNGQIVHSIWYCKTSGLFIDLLKVIEHTYASCDYDEIFVAVDNYSIHKARQVKD